MSLYRLADPLFLLWFNCKYVLKKELVLQQWGEVKLGKEALLGRSVGGGRGVAHFSSRLGEHEVGMGGELTEACLLS